MPIKKVQQDSDFELNLCSDEQQSSQHYNLITYEMRLQLIRLVIDDQMSVIKAAKKTKIKLSTAKFIINSYKKNGKIMRRKSQLKKSNKISQLSESVQEKQKQIIIEQDEKNQCINNVSNIQQDSIYLVPLTMVNEYYYYMNYFQVQYQNYMNYNQSN